MFDNIVKEQIGIHYLGLLAAKAGVFVNRPLRDSGVDLMFEKIERADLSDYSIRYFNSGETISVQLKCTTEKYVKREGQFVRFDLKGKNYNDLIIRRKTWEAKGKIRSPLLLLLCILPEDSSKWVFPISPYGAGVEIDACWYFPGLDEKFISPGSKKRISIPSSNKIDLQFLKNLFTLF
jgi:hypothetical protein